MTHAFVVDKRAKSTTSGMEVQTPVTVVEVPPMKVAAVRFYESSIVGLKTAGEVWAKDLDPLLDKRLNVPKNHDEASFARYDGVDIEDVRVLVYTQPKLVSGVPKKVPDLMELRIGGGTIDERVAYAKQILGTEGAEITPKGGFLNYGEVRNTYVLVHGSVPGPTKRLIRFRDATRLPKGAATEAVDVTYVSTESKQGA